MMTHNSNDVIALTEQAAMPAITFPSLHEVALPSSSLFLVVGCSCRCLVVVGLVVVIVMFKSLYLAEICTLTRAFWFVMC